MSVTPVPSTIEHAGPGGRELHEAQRVGHPMIVIGVEADLVDVEGLGAVDVGDAGRRTRLELHVSSVPGALRLGLGQRRGAPWTAGIASPRRPAW